MKIHLFQFKKVEKGRLGPLDIETRCCADYLARSPITPHEATAESATDHAYEARRDQAHLSHDSDSCHINFSQDMTRNVLSGAVTPF